MMYVLSEILFLQFVYFIQESTALYNYHCDSRTNETAERKSHSRKPLRISIDQFVLPIDRKKLKWTVYLSVHIQ